MPFENNNNNNNNNNKIIVIIIIISTKTRSARFNQILKQATTYTYTRIHSHIHLRQKHYTAAYNTTQFGWYDWLTHNETQTQKWMTYRPLSSFQQATPLLPRTPVFREFISQQLGLSRPTLPKLRHLLTKHRQCQRTPIAFIRCFLDFSSSHTPAFTPGL